MTSASPVDAAARGSSGHGAERPNTVILGNSGFFGSALQSSLERSGKQVSGFSSRELDLRRTDALATLDPVVGSHTTLVFCAAITPDRGDTLDHLEANLAMVQNVARYVAKNAPARVVYFSSDALYPLEVASISEESPVRTDTYYTIAKHAGESVLARVARDTGMGLLTLRATMLFGPGNTHGSYGPNRFIRSAIADRMIQVFGEGEERRDHLYIDDAVNLVTQLIDRECTGVVNLASGESRSFAEVAAAVREVAPFPVEVKGQPRRSPVTHREFDVERLRRATGTMAITPFSEGIRRTFAAEQAEHETR